MAGPKIIILSEVNQDDKEKYHITYMWNLKYDTNELICKTERLTDIENKLLVTKGERERGRDKIRSVRLRDTDYYV